MADVAKPVNGAWLTEAAGAAQASLEESARLYGEDALSPAARLVLESMQIADESKELGNVIHVNFQGGEEYSGDGN